MWKVLFRDTAQARARSRNGRSRARTYDGLLVRDSTPKADVREHNGTSNIAFDYRIVAKPYGSVGQRLPLYMGASNQVGVPIEGSMLQRIQRMIARVKSRHGRYYH
jgi:hypothetical protein